MLMEQMNVVSICLLREGVEPKNFGYRPTFYFLHPRWNRISNKTTDHNQDKNLFSILTIISHFMLYYNYEYSPRRNAIEQ